MGDFDVIVIGSGAGGLTAAVAAARAGARVAVFEQHSLPGGWCHTFRLGGYAFSPGVHYVGQLQAGGSLRAIYEGLGLGPDLTFYELDPLGMDRVALGETRFDIPRGRRAFADRLAAAFPGEARGIRGYLDAVQALSDQLVQVSARPGLAGSLTLPLRAPAVLRWSWRTADQMIRHFVRDPRVRGVLAAQAGDHGLPPSRVSAAVHAAITAHYFDGGWYPAGGGGALPRAKVRALARAGGEVHLRAPVAEILVEAGRAAGVRLADGTRVAAPTVISNADLGVTYGRLLPAAHQSRGLRRKLARQVYSVSALSLFMAAELDPAAADLTSGNLWLYDSPDVDAAYRHGLTAWDLAGDGPIPGMFLTVTSLKDPGKRRRDPGVHTLEAFCFVGYDAFRRWHDSASGARPAAYEAAKARLEARMLARLERRIPGLRERLVFSALGTPLTNRHYCAATRGNLYGTAKTRGQIGPLGFGVRTELPGLFLCGASTLSHGVAGATVSGRTAAARALGCRTRELLDPDAPPLTLRDAETTRYRVARGITDPPAVAGGR